MMPRDFQFDAHRAVIIRTNARRPMPEIIPADEQSLVRLPIVQRIPRRKSELPGLNPAPLAPLDALPVLHTDPVM